MGSLYHCGHCISGDLKTTNGQKSNFNEAATGCLPYGYFSGVEVGMFYWADVGMKIPHSKLCEVETYTYNKT